jgi:hypothetical protein
MRFINTNGALLLAAHMLLLQTLYANPIAGVNNLKQLIPKGKIPGLPEPKPIDPIHGPEPVHGPGGIPKPIEGPSPGGGGGEPHVPGVPKPGEGASTESLPKVVPLGPGEGFGKVLTLSAYESKGNQRYTAYENAKLKGTEDTPILADRNAAHMPQSFPDLLKLDDHYHLESWPGTDLDYYKPELDLFTSEDFGGVGFPDHHTEVKVFSVENGEVIGKSDDPSSEYYVLRGGYSEDGQFIFAKDAFKANDKAPANDPGRLPINELSYQAYASVAKENTKNLKAIILMDIQNKGFWAITNANYEERGIPITEKATWRRGDAANTKWFERFLGSDTINGKLLSTMNHHNALGDPIVDSIVTIPKNVQGKGQRMFGALVFKPRTS